MVNEAAPSSFVYVTYIRTTPEKLWSALTDAEFMKQYWFGTRCESRWTAGSLWKMVSGDGQITDAGPVARLAIPLGWSKFETGNGIRFASCGKVL